MGNDTKVWYHWMLNYTFGDLLAMGGIATIGRILFLVFNHRFSSSSPLLNILFLTIAGTAEGLVLGYIEWKSIQKLVQNLPGVPWIITTTAAVVVGWIFIVSPAIIYISFLSRFQGIHTFYLLIFAGLTGMCFGALISVPQSRMLKNHYSNSVTWIFANAASWMMSFVVIYSTFLFYSGSVLFNILLTGFACIVSGLLQGAITGVSLHFSMSPRDA